MATISSFPSTTKPPFHRTSPNRHTQSPKSLLRSPLSPHTPSLKSRLASGDTLYGLFLLSSSPTLAEIAGLAGYDFAVIDLEHSPSGISDALPSLRSLSSTSTPAILRLPESSPTWAKKALDLGPQGLIFPMIQSPLAARLAVSFCRFPPRGLRGSAHTLVRASAYGIDAAYLARCEEDLLIICQIETAAAADNVEAIAAVDGVDCLQMGPLDLSASMGLLCDPGNRKVREMLLGVEKRVLALRKPYLGGFAMPFDPPGDMKRRGYHMVAGAVDVGMFRKAAVEDVLSFRMAEEKTELGEEARSDWTE